MQYLDLVKKKGNFAFVESFDVELYKKLLNAESKIWINRYDSAVGLRKALEHFYRFNTYSEENADLANMMKLYHMNPLYSEHKDRMNTVRDISNKNAHDFIETVKKGARDWSLLPFDTYVNLFKFTFDMLRHHYIKQDERATYKFNERFIPIGSYFIYTAIVDESSECALKCHAHKKDDVAGNWTSYALIKIYKRKNENSTKHLKDIEVLKHLWNSSDSHSYFARFSRVDQTENNVANEFYIIRYELDQIPTLLTKQLISELNIEQRRQLALKMFRAIMTLHNLEQPLYHRNICPDNILICKNGNTCKPYIVNFEYAKLDNSITQTVISNVISKSKKANIQSAYVAPEIRGFDSIKGNVSLLQWEKADIYSLAILVIFVLTGHEFTGAVSKNPLVRNGFDKDFCDAIGKMISPAYDARPCLLEVKDIFENSLI